VVANTSWYLYNFRRNLMHVLLAEGHEVLAIAPSDDYARRLVAEGIPHRAIPLDGASTNPVRELRSLLALRQILNEEKVDVVLSFTPKGNIYSALAVMGRPTQLIANVSGLGRAFVERTWLTLLVRRLFQHTFGRATRVFFQNEDDRKIFVDAGLVDVSKTERIPGSGVDLSRFVPSSNDRGGVDAPVFLLIARLLWDKGVGEFVEAARLIRTHYPAARFQLLGFLDVANPSAVSRLTVESWVEEGAVEYLGTTDDVRPYIAAADCVVLPSFYREGVPRSLLEAAAMARPIITTDATGCRDTVDDGVTGFLCKPRDAQNLADQMLKFLSLPAAERASMGARGREKMIREFDERIVIDRYVTVIDGLMKSAAPNIKR
jgi:glycosyltransferase involved in cell wall biosynthesis